MAGLNGVPINGSCWGSPSAPTGAALPPEGEWLPADGGVWPRVVEDELVIEQRRLAVAIDAAKGRLAAAGRRDAEVRVAMYAEVVATQARVAEMEQQYEAAINAIREAGQAEVSGILSEARQRARLSGQRRLSAGSELGG